MKKELVLIVNGDRYDLLVPQHKTLLEVLRDQIGLTGTKNGCGKGECGACTVLLDGRPVNSCLVLAHEADGLEVETIEGLARGGDLHPLQKAFIERGAIQCGFCSPGMIMAAKGLLDHHPKASIQEIRHGMKGNLCRCTGYVKIMDAIVEARDGDKR